VVGLRRAFLVTALCYAIALVCVLALYDERSTHASRIERHDRGRVTFRSVLAFENFILLMAVIFAVQFFDRSFGPVLPLYIEQIGVSHDRVALVAGIVFSVMACAGALGHHACGKLLRRFSARAVVAGGAAAAALGCALLAATGQLLAIAVGSAVLGVGVGAAMTAAYTAAGSVIPAGAHGTGFGVLTSASLIGMAVSPMAAGLLGATGIRVVFLVDVVLMGIVAVAVRRLMTATDTLRQPAELETAANLANL
jgi:DHA1 family multidrug resistance protein-like MFS transporter